MSTNLLFAFLCYYIFICINLLEFLKQISCRQVSLKFVAEDDSDLLSSCLHFHTAIIDMSQPAHPRSHIFMNPLDSLIFFKTTILISSYELHPRDLFSFSFYVKNTWIPFHLLKVGLGLTPTFSVELSRTICGQRSLTSPSPCYLENTNMVLKVRKIPLPSLLFISLILTSSQGSHQVPVSSFFLFVCVMNLRL